MLNKNFRDNIKKILFTSSLITIPLNGGISWFSPSNVSQLISLLFNIKKKFSHLTLLLLFIFPIIVIIQSIYIGNYINLAKFIIVLGGTSFALSLINQKKLNVYVNLFFAYLLLDLIIRIFLIDSIYLDSIYFLKHSSGIAVDSNFIGMLISIAIMGAFENKNKSFKIILFLFFLLILTFSRSAYILIMIYFLSYRYKFFSIFFLFLSIFILIYLSNNYDLAFKIDGSLRTKAAIVNLFFSIAEFDLNLLFGFGRENIELLSFKHSIDDLYFNGHSIFGFISRDGVLFCIIFFILNFYFFYNYSSTKYLIPICLLSVGFVSLWPVSYFGVLSVVYLIFKNNFSYKFKFKNQ